MSEWDYENPRVYETRFEILTTHPYEEFSKAFRFVGLPIVETPGASVLSVFGLLSKKALQRIGIHIEIASLPRQWLHVILRRNSFQRRAKRRKGHEDQHHHYRKGISGDWHNYLGGEVKARFEERWGQLLIDLGYETDMEW